MLTRRKFSGLLAGAVAAPAIVRPGSARAADEWPNRTVTIVVPFSAGGSTDIIGRKLAEELKARFNQTFIVENRTGAAGNIGVESVVRAPNDGHTLLIGTVGSLTANQFLYDLKYNIARDLAPVTRVFAVDHILCVTKNFPATNIQELVAHAKANPGKVTYGSSGTGSSVHLYGVMLEMRTGVKMQHVPYRGSAPAINDLVAGHIDMIVDGIPSAGPQVEGGNLRALAVAAPKRNKKMPDVPTMKEAGVPDYDSVSWGTLMAPAGTPPAILKKISDAAIEAYKKLDVLKYFDEQGAEATATTPEETAAFLKRETEIWGNVIKTGNVKLG